MDARFTTRLVTVLMALSGTYLASPSGLILAAEKKCAPITEEYLPTQGSRDPVIFSKLSIRRIRGIVRAVDGTPMHGVQVEVLDHPETVLAIPDASKRGQQRIAACMTRDSGEFELKVPSGEYELRFSMPFGRNDQGWEWISYLIKVRRFSLRSRLSVHMKVGT